MSDHLISKVLIANRGEVVPRIARTLRAMGKKSVAIFTESDAGAFWIQSADEAVMIGGQNAYSGYLDQAGIIEAAKVIGADAIHPGFGFLSEDASFARNVRRNNIKFIGPSEQSIKDMGNKLHAKALAIKAGVNVIPGMDRPATKIKQILDIVEKIGYPIILKAAAGGGGKGIRVIRSPDELEDAFELTTSEAKKSFNDGSVFVEKYIESPRHIEIQIVADKHGNVVCIGERECSIQRRYQKIVEETPCVCVDNEIRERMYEQCASLVKNLGYYSVGTVEFVMSNKREFFFLEMNTRLQVEHTITEMVTGLDLVDLMVKIEEGDRLGIAQGDITFSGAAMETRIYAEDPENDFAPSIDRITAYMEPIDQTNLRIETGICEGSKINPHYDPMIVKLCAWGVDRSSVIELMKDALAQFVIHGQGISTNIIFLEYILRNPRFISGDISTNFVQDECSIGRYSHPPGHERNIMLAALCFLYMQQESLDEAIGPRRLIAKAQDAYFTVDTECINGDIRVTIGDFSLRFSAHCLNNSLVIMDCVGSGRAYVKVKLPKYYADSSSYYASFGGYYIRGRIFEEHVGEMFKRMPIPKVESEDPRNVSSQMSGMVVNIFVETKQKVKKGERLVCIEAMKMQNILYAKANSVIEDIYVEVGSLVNKGDLLITLLPITNE